MKRKILIADSDVANCQRLRQVLDDYDVTVHRFDQDTAAYEHFLEIGADLLVVDVLLPRRGGLDLVRRIRATQGGAHLPVIVVCPVKGCSDLKAEALDHLEAMGFFEKPFNEAQLRSRLDKVLTTPQRCTLDIQTPFALDEIERRGDLDKTPFAALFRALVRREFTGRLNLTRGMTRKVVYFQEGNIAFASSNRVTETLGRYMYNGGEISEETYRACLEQMQSTGKKFGELLVEMGALVPEAISRAVRGNVLDKVLEVFSWTSGKYALADYSEPPAALPQSPFEGHEALWSGIARKLSFGEILSVLRPYLELYLVARKDPLALTGEVGLEGPHQAFLQLARDFPGKQLQEALTFAHTEDELRVLFALILFDYVVFSDNPDCVFMEGGDDIDLLEKVYQARQELNALKLQNHFRVLGVPLEANDDQVNEAFRVLAKRLHPDTVKPEDPPELQQILAETFVLVRTAYEALKTRSARKDYLESLRHASNPDMLEGVAVLEAENLYQQGLALLRKRDWDQALDSLGRAYELNPDEAEYVLHYAVARMNTGSGDKKENIQIAQRLLRRAGELAPELAEPYYRLGLIAKLDGDPVRAFTFFQRALVRDPRHLESRREVRLLRTRESKKLKSLLSKKGKK